MDKRAERDTLLRLFSDYERAVWIVNSIEGHLTKFYASIVVYFDRYPKLERPDQDPLTPDFTVLFTADYAVVGEAKRALGKDTKAIEDRFAQLCSYDRPFKVRRSKGQGDTVDSPAHDLILMINSEYAYKEAKKLAALVGGERAGGRFERALSVFAVNYDNQQAKAKWILNWVNHSDRLRDDSLPADMRLSVRHQDGAEAIVIYPEEFELKQAVHYFCNDDPPPVYLAVLLWSRIFPRIIPQDKKAEWVDDDCIGPVEFPVTVDQVVEHARSRLDYIVTKDMVRNVMDLLVKAQLAKRHGQKEYVVRYKLFNPRADDTLSDDANLENSLDHTKQGLIRAIAGVKPPAQARPSGRRAPVRRSKSRTDKAQMTLGL